MDLVALQEDLRKMQLRAVDFKGRRQHYQEELVRTQAKMSVLSAKLRAPVVARFLEPGAIEAALDRSTQLQMAEHLCAAAKKNTELRTVALERASANASRRQALLTFYLSVLDDATEEYVERTEKSLNEVYSYVFQEFNKFVRIKLVDRYNRKVLAPKLYNIVDGVEHEETLDDSGYSLSVVLGTVLLVYFILYTGAERVIMFDEAISGLSAETSARFFELLHLFVRDLGFSFGIISHEIRYIEFADHVYTVRKGVFSEER